jgi:hypothetical protein
MTNQSRFFQGQLAVLRSSFPRTRESRLCGFDDAEPNLDARFRGHDDLTFFCNLNQFLEMPNETLT